ncbi:DNA topoisomerase 2-binding protein 1-A [Quercus lobata]|uniref:DNA topoisomerase 2-binding protein 1-A n=1 Tax=Quercus lobata TaxID=97700 RepID=UPI0012447436|nr:DNA topoisomerase 2-binding protein 1-A [Quercus lobata]
MMKTKTFKGANVLMSRNLVPPEIFDTLHDALKHNGADVFLCCDPSRSAPNDYHIISSPDHEKFLDLRAKGCNLLGPQCVLSCAKENRALPKQGYTCCFAMDGVKVLASGFEADEKVKIETLVTAMGGVLHPKASLDVSFVIVKNVLAAKYKWALNILKKPIVTIEWLHQCWNEHRVVPQESFRVLPFSGLTICVTQIPADERKEIEKLITQNGGKYSAELTKKCTHLICDAAEGDKYKVARRWGHIYIVTRKWFYQSIARRACLNEDSYPVQGGSVSSNKNVRNRLTLQHSLDKGIGNSQSVPSTSEDLNSQAAPSIGFADSDVEATLSQNVSSAFSDPPVFVKEGDFEKPTMQPNNETSLDGFVANDSQSEDGDLYLSECRILLVGFEVSEMRKLVSMVRRGGGSRYMSFNDKLTHIVVGSPSEIEKKEVRSLAALGVIYVVKPTWLEDCDCEKKEIPVLQRYIAYDLLLPKDSVFSTKGAVIGVASLNQSKNSTAHPSMSSDQVLGNRNSGIGLPSLEKNKEERSEINMKGDSSLKATAKFSEQSQLPVINGKGNGQLTDKKNGRQKTQHDSSVKNGKPSGVFKGRVFCFSKSFPEDRRAEIVQWVVQGGGKVVDDPVKQNMHYTIQCHGVITRSVDAPQTTRVSSHWIRSCLEEEYLLDVGSHILYSPLPCRIPLPGFERFRVCVSQYEEKDRQLLRNLCFVLGAKFAEKLTKKVTHLLCKFTNGPKYEAARKWGIHSITSEWIYECIRQNEVVALDSFRPKEVTVQDQEAGLCTTSQFPTQAVRMVSGGSPSCFPSQSQDLRNTATQCTFSRNDSFKEESEQSSVFNKRAKLLEDDDQKDLPSSKVHLRDPINLNAIGDNITKDNGEVSHAVPDVAAAIEDLLEQTSKIHDQNSPGRTGCDKNLFSSDYSILGQDHSDAHSVVGLSKHWLNRTGKNDDVCNPSGDRSAGIYDGFSETQTESQVVGYEEDLSGRQMLIDKVRTRSSLT